MPEHFCLLTLAVLQLSCSSAFAVPSLNFVDSSSSLAFSVSVALRAATLLRTRLSLCLCYVLHPVVFLQCMGRV